jgi:hypothetical protein
MKPIKVNKDQLVAALQENRSKHHAIFEEALEGYKIEAIRQLSRHLDRIRKGQPKRVYISIPQPEDHTSDYDTAIQMMAWSVDDVIELDEQSFKSYVLDDWTWKRQFLASNSFYSKTASDLLGNDDDDDED